MSKCCICGSEFVTFIKRDIGLSFCSKHEKYKEIPPNDLHVLEIWDTIELPLKEKELRFDEWLKTHEHAPRYAIDTYAVNGWQNYNYPQYHSLEEAIEKAKKENEELGGADDKCWTAVIDLFKNEIAWNPFGFD